MAELLLDPSTVRRTKDWRIGAEDEDEWARFRATIERIGVLEPALVGRDDDGYFLKSGHRRHRACSELGIALPVRIVDGEATRVAIVENTQRRRLRPAELATALTELLPNYEHAGALAEDMGLSASYVRNLVRIKQKVVTELWDIFVRYGDSVSCDRMAEIAALPKSEQVAAWNKSAERPGGAGRRRRTLSLRRVQQTVKRLEDSPREGEYWRGVVDALRSVIGERKPIDE
jgi:ParB/RepB/Spo0J family partition protein